MSGYCDGIDLIDQTGLDCPWYTPAQIAVHFGKSRSWTYSMIKSGELKACRVGGSWMIHRDELHLKT